MRILFAVLFFLTCSVRADQVPVDLARQCMQLRESTLSFTAGNIDPLVDQKFSSGELRDIVAAAPGDLVLSATELKPAVEIELTRHAVSDPQLDLHCARFSVRIRLGDAPHEVHIARELAAGSCMYDLVLNLEMRNVEASQARLAEVAAVLTVIAEAEFGRRIWVGTLDEVDAGVRAELTAIWLTRASEMLQTADAAHVSLDAAMLREAGASACTGQKPALTAAVASFIAGL